MFEFVLIVAAFIILLMKIHKVEDRIGTLEKRGSSQVSPVTVQIPTPQQSPIIPVPPPINNEEEWGRVLGVAGVVAVILGVSFFLKYAFANNIIGVTGRVIIGIIAGIAFISAGQYLREKYRAYSNILIGCGIGLLYLTTFASFAFYNLISSPVAYGLLIGISALSVVLSIVDKAIVLAMIGVIGGFLTPVFMTLSNASLSQVLTYVLILNVGVMVVAYVYKWRKLTATAFAGTWLLVFMCFMNLYEKTDRVEMAMFLFLYFAVFLLSSLFHHVIRKEMSDYTDLAIIVVNGLGYTAVTYTLLYEPFKNFMGFFMILMALLYFAIALLSFKTNKENKLLNMFLPAMAALFLTLAIPAQLDGPWIALAWFVEAILMYMLDYSLKGKNLYSYGVIVFVVSAIYTFIRYVDSAVYGKSFNFLWNERFFIFLVGIVTAYLLAFIISKAVKDGMDLTEGTKSLMVVYFVVAQVASIFILTSEISQLYSSKVYAKTEVLNKEIVQLQQNYYSVNTYNNVNAMTDAQIADYQNTLAEKSQELSKVTQSNSNERNTVIDIVWILYALISIAIGFSAKSKWFRTTGLVLMAITAVKIFVDVWDLGPVYRIVTSLVFGIIALVASFIYAKYKDKLKVGAVTLMLIGVLSFPGFTFAATDRELVEASPYRAEISSASMIQGRPTRLALPAEVQEKSNISDIRVFTGIGAQVPYTLNYSSFSEKQEVVNLDVKNLSVRNGQLEFLLDNKEQLSLTHNSINFLNTSSQTNFRYIIRVYGSDVSISIDSNNWRELTLDTKPQYVFNFYDTMTGRSVSNYSISYEPSSTKFLKIILIPFDKNLALESDVNFNNNLFEFKPKNVMVGGVITQQALVSGLKESPISMDTKIVQNEKNQTTEIYVDFKDKGVLVNGIDLVGSSLNFYRNVSVQVKNDVVAEGVNNYQKFIPSHNGEWYPLGNVNSIYSFTKEDGTKLESLRINFPMTKASHYKIVIDNQDNQPLSLEPKVIFNAPVAVLTFIPRSQGPFYLYFGGNLSAPVYDIDSVLENTSLKQKDISTVVVSSVLSNPEYKPIVPVIPFSEKYAWLLNVVLVLLVAFIALLIVSYVRKVRKLS